MIVAALARSDINPDEDGVPLVAAGEPIPLDLFPADVLHRLVSINAATLDERVPCGELRPADRVVWAGSPRTVSGVTAAPKGRLAVQFADSDDPWLCFPNETAVVRRGHLTEQPQES